MEQTKQLLDGVSGWLLANGPVIKSTVVAVARGFLIGYVIAVVIVVGVCIYLRRKGF